VDTMILVEQRIVFGGKCWRVVNIDTEKKVINVERAKGGEPPKFGGSGMDIHDVVRQDMFSLYCDGDYRITAGFQGIFSDLYLCVALFLTIWPPFVYV
ncbi:hypothetical protein OQ486_14415, partial [Plesiomonas shigelloides]|nr:hypothetical protein [Plesiomonas shigelloides]